MLAALETKTGSNVEAVDKSKKRSKRKLFISYRGLIMRLVENQVTDPDLKLGLFYFGCIRENAAAIDNPDMQTLIPDMTEAQVVHARLWQALDQAEKEERVAWRRAEHPSSFDQLNDLLRKNNFRTVESPNGPFYGVSTYPTVKDIVERANQTLEVIF